MNIRYMFENDVVTPTKSCLKEGRGKKVIEMG
jgi:hypothetical protein